MVTSTSDLDLSGYVLEFEDDFARATPDPDRWHATYLPQWSTTQRSAARFRHVDGRLRLSVEADQLAWAPDIDGEMRVSNLQTGVRSGPVGSADGQHRFRPDLRVRTPQDEVVLYAPTLGVVEARVRALHDETAMVALWMIGVERDPAESAEICVFEIFGRSIENDTLAVGMGVHPFHDPAVEDDFAPVAVPGAGDLHTYAVERLEDETRFFIDGVLARSVPQGIAYPMQLMLNIYEFPAGDERPAADYPKLFEVEFVRGYGRDAR